MVSVLYVLKVPSKLISPELAHNLESAHNAAHEFYFSSIAEEYLVRFVPLLQTSRSVPTDSLI